MNKPFVLVVEDDNAVRNLIATTLETHDYKYHTSQTGCPQKFDYTLSPEVIHALFYLLS